jgi:hypothetical protein
MSSGMPLAVWIFIKIFDFLFINGDGKDFFLLELIGMSLVPLDNEKTLVSMQPDFSWY